MLRKIGRILFGNFKAKLLALVMALGIWFYANARVTRTIALEARIQVSPPPGYSLVYQDRATAQLRIAGPDFLISRLEHEARQVTHTLRYQLSEDELTNGRARLTVRPEWLQFEMTPQEMVQLRFPGIEPQRVRVVASPITEELKPVRVPLSGSPPRGFRVEEDPVTAPRQVRVRGPAIAVEAIESIATERLPVWDLRAGEHRRPLELQDTVRMRLNDREEIAVPLELSESRVVARIVVVEEAREERTIADQPLRFMKPADFPYDYEVQDGPITVDITVRASPSALARLDAVSVRPYLDLTLLADEQLAPGESGLYREPVHVAFVGEVDYDSIQLIPAHVTLLLKNPLP